VKLGKAGDQALTAQPVLARMANLIAAR